MFKRCDVGLYSISIIIPSVVFIFLYFLLNQTSIKYLLLPFDACKILSPKVHHQIYDS